MVHDPLIMTDWSCCQGTLLSTAWLVVKPVWANHQQKSPMASYTPMRQGKTHPFSTEFPNCKPLSLSSTLNLGKFFLSGSEKSHPRCFTRKAGNKPWTTDPKTQTPTHGLSGVRRQKITGIIHKNSQHLLCRRMTDTSLQCSVLKHGQNGHLSW